LLLFLADCPIKKQKIPPFLEEKERDFTFRNTLRKNFEFPHFSHCFQQSTKEKGEFSTEKAAKNPEFGLFPRQ